MDKINKQLAKLSDKDRAFIRSMLIKIAARDFTDLQRKKLKGFSHIFRVRARHLRIIYFDDGEIILLKKIERRNEKTYKGI